ncbi:MAG: mannosyltransferase family protein [Chthoniobacterales bacterium]
MNWRSLSDAVWLQRVRRWDWETIALLLALKAILLFFAVQTFAVRLQSYGGVLEVWRQWDAVHYIHLAEHGYSASGKDQLLLAFFPLYPWLVRGCAVVVRDPIIAAFVVSGVASIAAALLLRQLAEADESPLVARTSVWFFAIFPTAYFLHISYTEATFLAFTLGCLVAARREHWLAAGLLGACASLTRINGLVLLPVLAVEALQLWRTRRKFDPRSLWSLMPVAGFLVYLWLNQRVAGDAFAFAHIQQEHWYHKLAPPWVGILDVWQRIGGLNAMEGLHEFLYIAFTFACTIWCWMKLRPSYGMWMTCNWLLITSTKYVLSVPRYSLTLFPIFILLGRACAGRPLPTGSISAFSLIFMALYVSRFVHGLWAF